MKTQPVTACRRESTARCCWVPFNIRKLGSSRSRSPDTWEFLADVCRSFDLLAVQEIMDDLSGLRRLMSLLGPEFSLVVSDLTGVFPGEPGLGERLGFIYRWNTVERMEVSSDVTFDRTKIIDSIAENYEAFVDDLGPYSEEACGLPVGTAQNQAQAQAECLPVLHPPALLRGVPHSRASRYSAVRVHGRQRPPVLWELHRR